MVSLEKYKCLCQDAALELELFESKKGVQYIRCKRDGCGFFTQARDFQNYLNVIEEKLLLDYKELDTPMCNHLMPATLWLLPECEESGETLLQGWPDGKLRFFQWGDKSPALATMGNISKREEKRKPSTPFITRQVQDD